jgi:hypothetical protein
MQKIMSYIPVNWELIKNPVNWVIIFLMVTLAGMALAAIMKHASGNDATDNGEV